MLPWIIVNGLRLSYNIILLLMSVKVAFHAKSFAIDRLPLMIIGIKIII